MNRLASNRGGKMDGSGGWVPGLSGYVETSPLLAGVETPGWVVSTPFINCLCPFLKPFH